MIKQYLIDAMSGFMSSFDGETIRYLPGEQRVCALIERAHRGPERDYLNFSQDMYAAIRHEYDRQERNAER
jgi:hypothetical protein